MYLSKLWPLLLAALIALGGCASQSSVAESEEIVGPQLAISSGQQPPAEPPVESSPAASDFAYPAIWNMLHQFNWMGSDGILDERGNYTNELTDKPFLKRNNNGMSAAAGISDINQDGTPEFLLSVVHVPRGIPAVEVFAMKDGSLKSIGGYFESGRTPQPLSYYRDPQGRLLFVRSTESHYGQITKCLVATDADTLQNTPIAWYTSDYTMQQPDKYFILSGELKEDATQEFLNSDFLESELCTNVSQSEYEQVITNYMDSLSWVEDVPYQYCIAYHFYNGADLLEEVRFDEINEAQKNASADLFQTQKEFKITSNMVSDALYEAYLLWIATAQDESA